MATFPPPTAFSADKSPRAQAKAFGTEYQPRVWCSGNLAGGEPIVALVLKMKQPVTTEQAKQLATRVENQLDEVEQSGAMLVDTLPESSKFPDDHGVRLRVAFELLPIPK